MLICVLGTLFLWPKLKEPVNYDNINVAYDSICMITSGTGENRFIASGVLLESGYVLTAAHVVDRNFNNKIDDNERFITVKFPALGDKEIQAEAIASDDVLELDLAILNPQEEIDLPGVRLMSNEDYWNIKIGTPLYTIGMGNGEYPGNITDGRMIEMDRHSNAHRNSANSYFGNSGGGVFVDEELVGIAVAVGMGRQELRMPVFTPQGRQVGMVMVPYNIPLANSSRHVPATSIRNFLASHYLDDVLWEAPRQCPYTPYLAVAVFNLVLASLLFLVYGVLLKWMKRKSS